MAFTPILAQAAQAQDAPVYVVSYIEVVPPAGGTAAGLLGQPTMSRKDEGNTRFDILQRLAPSNQFAIVAIRRTRRPMKPMPLRTARVSR
jgi:hypothetical protein